MDELVMLSVDWNKYGYDFTETVSSLLSDAAPALHELNLIEGSGGSGKILAGKNGQYQEAIS
jgi:hypothetical protein